MSPERWRQIDALYVAAREVDPELRSAFLGEACGDDEELRAKVQAMLARDGSGEQILDVPAADLLKDVSAPVSSILAVGTQLGPYSIEGLLGEGGMGKVYKAQDTRLGRPVAIKILTAQFEARFQREARAIAALNHPHICTLHDIGTLANGSGYLVMESIEGESVATRLRRGALSIDLVLRYGAQIASALAEAHSLDLVHRDLKPGNVMIAKNGVKVLDFGLAKFSRRPDSQEAETLTHSQAVLGTLSYMAPEQLEGKECDARSDIYSLGLVLYEMATGKRAGQDRPVPMEGVPGTLAHVIRRCLERDPSHRWQATSDVQAELRWAGDTQTQAVPEPSRLRPRVWLAAAAIFVLGALGGWAILHLRQPTADERVVQFQIEPPEGGQFPFRGTLGGIALSPDGKTAAYVANVNGKTELWVRPLNGTAARPLAGTEAASHPFWSADSNSIGFFSNAGRLRRVEAAGGAPLTVCDGLTLGGGGAWSADGQIVFGMRDSPLFRVPASGGKPVPLTMLNVSHGEIGHYWPQMLPGGHLLYWVQSDKPENTGVYGASLAKPDERIKLVTSDTNALYASRADGKGYLLWLRGETLVAQEFDAAALTLAGEPHTLAGPVSKIGIVGRMNASIGSGGVLLYSASGTSTQLFTWFDRTGKPLETVGDQDSYSTFRLSPDTRRAVASRDRSGGTDLFLLDITTRLSSRFTLNSSVNVFPIWSPSGRTIMFTATRSLFRRDSDGAGKEQPVIPGPYAQAASDWSRDGRLVLFWETAPGTQTDLWTLRVTPDGKAVAVAPGETPNPMPYLRTPFQERYGRFSPEPNPRWVAYQSDDSGQNEVYIAAFPEPRSKIRISTGGGSYPQWGANGRELFYVAPGNKLMAVNLKQGPDSIEPSAPRELFVLPILETGVNPYDTAPDGQRFLVRATPREASEPLTVILNWPALLTSPQLR